MDPLPVSPYDNDDASFQIIAVTALEVYPDAVVVPGLMIANTDTKHYTALANRETQPSDSLPTVQCTQTSNRSNCDL